MVTSTSCLMNFKWGGVGGGGDGGGGGGWKGWLLAQATTTWGCLQQPHVGFPERDSKPDILWLQNTQVSRAKNNCPRVPATQRWRGRGLFTVGEGGGGLKSAPSPLISGCLAAMPVISLPLSPYSGPQTPPSA